MGKVSLCRHDLRELQLLELMSSRGPSKTSTIGPTKSTRGPTVLLHRIVLHAQRAFEAEKRAQIVNERAHCVRARSQVVNNGHDLRHLELLEFMVVRLLRNVVGLASEQHARALAHTLRRHLCRYSCYHEEAEGGLISYFLDDLCSFLTKGGFIHQSRAGAVVRF